MKKQQVDNAVRFASNDFDKWNDVAGIFDPSSSAYSEIQGVIETAVHIGIQMALFGKIIKDENGDVATRHNEIKIVCDDRPD